MPLDGNLAAAHARSVEHFANVAHLGARTGGEIRLVELEEHVGEVDDDATIGLAHVEVSPLELLDELAIAGELLIARIELLIPRLELIADDGPAEPTERAANGSSGCGVAGRVPDEGAGAGAESRSAERAGFTLRRRTGARNQPQRAHRQDRRHTIQPSHSSSPPRFIERRLD